MPRVAPDADDADYAAPGSGHRWRRHVHLAPAATTTDGRWDVSEFRVDAPSVSEPLTGAVATSAVLGEVVVHIATPERAGVQRTTMRLAALAVVAGVWGSDGSDAVSWEYAHCDRPQPGRGVPATRTATGGRTYDVVTSYRHGAEYSIRTGVVLG